MIIITVILLLASGVILVKNYSDGIVASGIEDTLTLNLSEYKTCCTYFDDLGKEKSCIIKNKYDCNICESTCS